MNISEIFTKKNLEILELLMKKPFHIRDIASQLKCSPAKAHATIQLFKRIGLVKELSYKNRKVIVLEKNNGLLEQIQKLIHFEKKGVPSNETIGLFDNISPLDFRYYGRDEKLVNEAGPYLSEEGFVRYLAKVEAALARALAKRGICSEAIADEIEKAAKQVTAHEVYAEEDRIKHNIRALANCIRSKVSEKAKPYVHYTATSHDIICSADAARYNDFISDVLWKYMLSFEKTLIGLAEREKTTVQIGRTHGQHAEPITFGFAIAQYVSRFGSSMEKIRKTANNLRGKMAGAVGAYNASSLSFADPIAFERDVLDQLGIKPSPIATQVVEAEYMADFVHSVLSAFGVLANLADDMRHLQRSEIGEVGEFFESQQVGSSTMPQKRNPINFENVKSLWKVFMPRIATSYMDQISEHQRDLTNSASSRFIPEILIGFLSSVIRLDRVMKKLVVDKNNLKKNFDQNKDMIVAEPLYILLASYAHPDAHEYVREKTLESQKTGKPLIEMVKRDKTIQKYMDKFTKKQMALITNPENYTGVAVKKTEEVCSFWRKKLKI